MKKKFAMSEPKIKRNGESNWIKICRQKIFDSKMCDRISSYAQNALYIIQIHRHSTHIRQPNMFAAHFDVLFFCFFVLSYNFFCLWHPIVFITSRYQSVCISCKIVCTRSNKEKKKCVLIVSNIPIPYAHKATQIILSRLTCSKSFDMIP